MLICAFAAFVLGCGDTQPPQAKLRVGVLEFGTVNWELSVVQSNNLARKRGVDLEVVPFASENALAVALRDDRVDVVVSDWLWAARQRTEGHDYQFAPYSLAVGAVMVNPGGDIDSVKDLAGEKLGVAGGPVDKTWLLLRAYADRSADLDVDSAADITYAASPVINELMLDGKLPAAVNYWHYNARLKALGMEPLITVEEMLAELDVETVPPLLGWVFSGAWARKNADALRAFLQATYEAKSLLAESDAAWGSVRDLVKPESEAVFAAIKAGYRAGIPRTYGEPQIEAAGQLFDILAAEGGGKLTGGVDELPAEVFWDGFRLK